MKHQPIEELTKEEDKAHKVPKEQHHNGHEHQHKEQGDHSFHGGKGHDHDKMMIADFKKRFHLSKQRILPNFPCCRSFYCAGFVLSPPVGAVFNEFKYGNCGH